MANNSNDGPLLGGPISTDPAADPSLLQPLMSLPPEDQEVIGNVVAALAPHVEALAELGQRMLAPPAAAPAEAPAGARAPAALLAGLMQGMGAKYRAGALSSAGEDLERRLMGLPRTITAPVKPTRPAKPSKSTKPEARKSRPARSRKKG